MKMCECPELKTLIETSQQHHNMQAADIAEIKACLKSINDALNGNDDIDKPGIKTKLALHDAKLTNLSKIVWGIIFAGGGFLVELLTRVFK
jgi:hypothetical protein